MRSSSLQANVYNLYQAYIRFFLKQAKYPRFKSLRHCLKNHTIKNNRNIEFN